MKTVLKNILLVYVSAIIVLIFGILVLLPVILSTFLNDDRYMLLYIITLPVILGVIFKYTDKMY